MGKLKFFYLLNQIIKRFNTKLLTPKTLNTKCLTKRKTPRRSKRPKTRTRKRDWDSWRRMTNSEFPADEWSGDEEDSEDVNVWEDNWDEDTVEDDFSKQLRAELEKTKTHDVEMKS